MFLDALANSDSRLSVVVTQPPRRRARRSAEERSPVHERAEALGVPVETPQNRAELIQCLDGRSIDLAIVVAYGRIIPPELLARARYINVHFSKLPRWRGAAPVERAILEGDAETAVALMEMEAGLDTGGVLAERTVPIPARMTSGALKEVLVREGCDLLVRHLPELTSLRAVPQRGEPTYASKLEVGEFRITPQDDASRVDRLVRAGTPRPGAYVEVGDQRVKLWSVAPSDCGSVPSGEILMENGQVLLGLEEEAMEILEVQAAGRSRMKATDWWRGLNTSRLEFLA